MYWSIDYYETKYLIHNLIYNHYCIENGIPELSLIALLLLERLKYVNPLKIIKQEKSLEVKKKGLTFYPI